VSLVNLLFGYKGRINRLQYWLGSLGVGVAGGVAIFLAALLVMPVAMQASKESAAQSAPLLLILWGLIMMVMGWAGTALQWKRFHDRGRPGWVAFAPLVPVMMIFVSVANGVLTDAPFTHVLAAANGWLLLLWAINLYFFVELGCLGSQHGPNTYGDPPNSAGGYTPPAPQAPTNNAPASAMSSLFGAQSAMERAIAEQARVQATPRPAVATPGPAPNGASFGRRAAR